MADLMLTYRRKEDKKLASRAGAVAGQGVEDCGKTRESAAHIMWHFSSFRYYLFNKYLNGV